MAQDVNGELVVAWLANQPVGETADALEIPTDQFLDDMKAEMDRLVAMSAKDRLALQMMELAGSRVLLRRLINRATTPGRTNDPSAAIRAINTLMMLQEQEAKLVGALHKDPMAPTESKTTLASKSFGSILADLKRSDDEEDEESGSKPDNEKESAA